MIIGNVEHQKLTQNYVETWFWNTSTLCKATNMAPLAIQQMVDAKIVPGIIYAHHGTEEWWNALAAYTGQDDQKPEATWTCWYSPAAAWWLRRALILQQSGHSLSQIESQLRGTFEQKFIALLPQIDGAALAYQTCFSPDGSVNTVHAIKIASSEWEAWVAGANAVCLRDFTADTCIRKEALSARIKHHFDDNEAYALSDMSVLDLCQDLASLITPFSPWERRNGTPGKTIDVMLAAYQLGVDTPAPTSNLATTI